ncbi:MAG: cassette chromosome recombinase [Frankiales bacterium]|nr:cassette chromosome recombinase [Frankiales bacterium]
MNERPHLRTVPAAGLPRFAIAVRVSRVMGRSGDRFLSPEIQISGARGAIDRTGGVLDLSVGDSGVFYDLDVSGATAPSDRPGLGAALELVRAGRIAGVAVYDLSRFSRDTAGGLRELEDIAAAGGQVISAAETIDISSPHGLFATTIQLAANRLARDDASRRWKATHQSRHDRGLPHGKIPMGYLPDGAGGVAVDPALASTITESFVNYAAGTVSQVAISQRLTLLRGRVTRQGVVSRLLRNPFFTGEVSYHGDVRQGRHEALVTRDVFDAVQRRLAADKHAGPRDRVPVTCLQGLIRCEVCKKPLHRRGRGSLRPDTSRQPTMMRCSDMAAGCVGVGAPKVAELEQEVRAHVLAMAARLRDGTPELALRQARATRARSDATKLRGEAKLLTASLGNAGALLARHVMDEAGYAAAVAEINRELASINARIVQAEDDATKGGHTAERLASAAALIEAEWDDLTPQERRAALRLFIDWVHLSPSAYRGQPVAERLHFPDEE